MIDEIAKKSMEKAEKWRASQKALDERVEKLVEKESRVDCTKVPDNINDPPHYRLPHGMDLFLVQMNILSRITDGREGWLLGKILGYLVRYPEKNGVEDVKKAKWFIRKLIEHLEAK